MATGVYFLRISLLPLNILCTRLEHNNTTIWYTLEHELQQMAGLDKIYRLLFFFLNLWNYLTVLFNTSYIVFFWIETDYVIYAVFYNLFWNGRRGLSESEITFLKEVFFKLLLSLCNCWHSSSMIIRWTFCYDIQQFWLQWKS
jgi:hypothetical protein